MAEDYRKRVTTETDLLHDFSGHCVGTIALIDDEGRAHVNFDGNRGAPRLARSIIATPAPASDHPAALVGTSVLLAFENQDPMRPIILGVVSERLRPQPVRPELQLDVGKNRDVVIDGQRLVFDAKQEVILRCGKSTIVLRRDGKILIRGTDLVSRSSGPNRIKGGSINLN